MNAYVSIDPQVDSYGLNKITYIEDLKGWEEEEAKDKEKKVMLFGCMLQYLSVESLDAVQCSAEQNGRR